MLGDLEDVGAHERVATGEDEDRVRERGDLIDEGEALLSAQLTLIGAVDRRGAAVHAGEVAAARDLPGDDARRRGAGCVAGPRARVLRVLCMRMVQT
jgi:hypothetical protein